MCKVQKQRMMSLPPPLNHTLHGINEGTRAQQGSWASRLPDTANSLSHELTDSLEVNPSIRKGTRGSGRVSDLHEFAPSEWQSRGLNAALPDQ